jgi:hypothetical protein
VGGPPGACPAATVDVSLLVDAAAVGLGPGAPTGRAWSLQRAAELRPCAGAGFRVEPPYASTVVPPHVPRGTSPSERDAPPPSTEYRPQPRVDVSLLHVGGGAGARVTTTGVPGGPDERPSDDPAPQAGRSTWNLPPLSSAVACRLFHVEPAAALVRRGMPVVPRGTCRRSGPLSHAGRSTWNLPKLSSAVRRRSFHVEPRRRRVSQAGGRSRTIAKSHPSMRSCSTWSQLASGWPRYGCLNGCAVRPSRGASRRRDPNRRMQRS